MNLPPTLAPARPTSPAHRTSPLWLALGLVTALGVGACQRPDGQLSDREAAAAPKESATLGAAIDDTAITARIKQRLISDARTHDAAIDVATYNGVVTLSGMAPTAEGRDAAEELARNVSEVQGIDNRIHAPSELDDLSARAGAAAEQAGGAISDARITTQVKAKFAADSQVKATAIDVDTDHGVVMLQGKVASDRARDRAVALAAAVEGVKHVDDGRLEVANR